MTKYKLPAVGDVVKTRCGSDATIVWTAPPDWHYRIWGFINGEDILSWNCRGEYDEGNNAILDLILEPEPVPASFADGGSVKWLGQDGGRQVVLGLEDRRRLIRDLTGELHLVPESDLQPWSKRKGAGVVINELLE